MVSGSEEPLKEFSAEAIFNSSPDAILIVDYDGNIRRVNHQAELLFEATAGNLEGKVVEDLIPKELRQIHRQYREEYQNDPRPRLMGLGLALNAINSHGREVPVDVALAPVVASTGVFTIATIRHRLTKKENAIPQLFRVISGKNPFQAWLMAFMFLVSFPLLFNAPPPNSIGTVVPHWAVLIWAFTMAGGAVANLVGIYWRKRIDVSVWLEMSSCLVIALSNLLYPASIITFALDSANSSISASNIWFVVTLLTGFSISAMGRFYQLLRDRKEVSQVKKLIRAAGVSS
jgi:PAS domain S-box-containing protein